MFLDNDKVDLQSVGNQGMSPLHFAVQGQLADKSRQAVLEDLSDSPEIAEMLLKKGINVDIAHQNGFYTPLVKACATDGHSSLPLLIAHGADVNFCGKSQNDMNALIACFHFGTTECLKVIMKQNLRTGAPTEDPHSILPIMYAFR